MDLLVFIYFLLTSKVKCNIILGSGVQRDDLFLYVLQNDHHSVR